MEVEHPYARMFRMLPFFFLVYREESNPFAISITRSRPSANAGLSYTSLEIRTPLSIGEPTRLLIHVSDPVPSAPSLLRIPPQPRGTVLAVINNPVEAPLGVLARHVRRPAEAVAGVGDDAVDGLGGDTLGVAGEV